MLFPLHLCLALAQQPADLTADPRLDRHVTYQTVAAPAKPAIAGLAQAAGVPLAAGGTIQSEILLLRVVDVPIRDVMVRLAHATAATWVPESGTYYLSRTDADVARRAAADHALLVASVRKEFAKQAKDLAAEAPFDAVAARNLVKALKELQNPKANAETGNRGGVMVADVDKLQQGSPTGRFAARVFSRVDPEVLAQAPPRRRTVFSTNPTKMEAPLHLDIGDAAQEFVAEQATYADEMGTLPEPDRQIIGRLYQRGAFNAESVRQAPAKLNIVVSRLDNNPDSFQVELQLYDAAGARQAESTLTIRTDPDFPSEKELMADPNEQKLVVSPDDTTLMQVLGSTLGGKAAKVTVLPDSIRARLLRPDLNEPLASFASSLLLGSAETKHLNLVAELPDAYVILGATPGFTGLPTATSILKLAKALPSSIGPVSVDDRWIEIAGGQAMPGAIMSHRANRVELGQLFGSASDGVLTIPGLARYAYVGDAVPDDFMFLLLCPLLFPGSEVNGSDQWRTYRLIGSLMHRQADAPLKPGRIPFASLDADSLAQVENIVFYQQTYGLTGPRRTAGVIGEDEPCELLPNGLPRDGYVDVTTTDEEAVFAAGPRIQEIAPSTLAWYEQMQEHPDQFGGGSPPFTIKNGFRVGSLHRVNLNLQLAAGIAKTLSVKETHLRPGAPVTFSQLSKSFRDQYQQAKDMYQKQNQ